MFSFLEVYANKLFSLKTSANSLFLVLLSHFSPIINVSDDITSLHGSYGSFKAGSIHENELLALNSLHVTKLTETNRSKMRIDF